MLPELLRPTPRRAEHEEAAFTEHNAELSRQLALAGASLIILAIVLWWPLDDVVIPEGPARGAFAQLRTGSLWLLVPAFAVFAWLRLPPRPTLLLATSSIAGFMGVVGYSLGGIGGDDFGWFGDACLGALATAWIPMTLGWRVATTAMVGSALAIGYFGLHPANLERVGAWGQLSFLGFAVAFAVVVGEAWYRVTRKAFFAQHDLADANDKLAAAGRDLSRQVAERTERLRSLARHLDTGLENERRRIGHELHDDLAQRLTAMRYVVARLERRLPASEQTALARSLTDELNQLLDGMVGAVGEVTARLRPRILDEMGLGPALEWLCDETSRRTFVPCTLEIDEDVSAALASLSATEQLALFRAAQEGITNALKHASAKRIDLALGRADERLCLCVRDDGHGEAHDDRKGLGLLGLAERFSALDGRCALGPRQDSRGSELRAELPLPTPEPE